MLLMMDMVETCHIKILLALLDSLVGNPNQHGVYYNLDVEFTRVYKLLDDHKKHRASL